MCLLIDVAIPSDRNIIQKGTEKELKYKYLSMEIQRMQNKKCFVISVNSEYNGIVTERLKTYLVTNQESIQQII